MELTINDFQELAIKYGKRLNSHFNGNFLKFITGKKEYTECKFEYCGVGFRYNDLKGCVEVNRLPFYIAMSIYEEFPDNPYGICYTFDEKFEENISPMMGVTDDEYEDNLKKLYGLKENDNWSHLLADATKELSKRNDEDKYLKFCKVYSAEGLNLILSRLKDYNNTLERWARVNNISLPNLKMGLRDKLNMLDSILISGNNNSSLNDAVIRHIYDDAFITVLQYRDEKGGLIILEHMYSKRNDAELTGECIRVKLLENNEVVNEMIYNLSSNECLRLDTKNGMYVRNELTDVDLINLVYILNESINYGALISKGVNHTRS